MSPCSISIVTWGLSFCFRITIWIGCRMMRILWRSWRRRSRAGACRSMDISCRLPKTPVPSLVAESILGCLILMIRDARWLLFSVRLPSSVCVMICSWEERHYWRDCDWDRIVLDKGQDWARTGADSSYPYAWDWLRVPCELEHLHISWLVEDWQVE